MLVSMFRFVKDLIYISLNADPCCAVCGHLANLPCEDCNSLSPDEVELQPRPANDKRKSVA